MKTSLAYERCKQWATDEGFNTHRFPAINGFVQRVLANVAGVEKRRTSEGRFFYGLVVRAT